MLQPPTSFIGREREIAQIKQLLHQVRLITITGPGGVGKTRLALQALDSSLEAHSVTHVVDLSTLSQAQHVLHQIAISLGLNEAGETRPLTRIATALHGRQAILLLDNCEHVIQAAADLAALLSAVPDLRIIATSRTPWHIRGEHEFPVGPLRLPEHPAHFNLGRIQQSAAVMLFVARAQAVRPDFQLNGQNAPAIAQICARLDGLPLAIELAAARLRTLSPQALLERLQVRLPLLTGGPRDAPARQRTLRDTIAWSVDLLAEPEQQLFAQLAIFVGGSTLVMIGAVCNPDGDEFALLDSLTVLVEQNLLQTKEVAGETRYSMLETVREYANERLQQQPEQRERLRQRLAAYLCSLCEAAEPLLLGAAPHAWYSQLTAERGNLDQTLAWAAHAGETQTILRIGTAIWRFWWACGGNRVGLMYMQQALSRNRQPLTPTAQIRALNAIGNLAWTLADYSTAVTAHQEALAHCDVLGDQVGMARHTYNLGIVAEYQGDDVQAEAFFTRSLALYRQAQLSFGIGLNIRGLAAVALQRGAYGQALELAHDAVAILRNTPDRFFLVWSLNQLGAVLLANQQPAAAASAGAEAATILGAIDGQVLLVDALLVVACAGVALGDAERGTRLFAAAETLRARQHWPLSPKTYALIVPYVRAVRTMLTSEQFYAAWRNGEGLPLAAALDLALQPFASPNQLTPPAVLPTPPPRLPSLIEPLTPRELEVLALLVEGLTNKQIAERLVMSSHTVHSHVRTIFSKLHVSSRASATRAAIAFGLINEPR